MRATETLHRALDGMPLRDMKEYGKGIIVKVENSVQSKLLQRCRPLQHSNISFIFPHRVFDSVERVIYSKDLCEFSEGKILGSQRSPLNVDNVQ